MVCSSDCFHRIWIQTSTAIKHQLDFIRAVSWSVQFAESHWSHVHITLTAEHFNFHAFYEKGGLQHDWMSCSSRLTLQRR